jgi:hypothetical protein
MEASSPAGTPSHDKLGPVRVGFVGRLLLAWTMAGGLVFGAFMSVVQALTDPGRSTVDPSGGLGLFGFGAFAGFAHGCMLAWFGRPRTVGPRVAARRMLHGIVLAIPGTLVAMMLSVSIATGPAAWNAGRTTVWLGAVVAALIALGICIWASVLGVRALGNALSRWPDRKPGVLIAALCFAALAAMFLLQRPEIWGTDVRVTSLGAVLLALGVTIWIAVPLEVLALHWLHRRRPSPLAR